jgi:hypothetical protein
MKLFGQRIILWLGPGFLILATLACITSSPQQTATLTPIPLPTETSIPAPTSVPLFQLVSVVSTTRNETSDSPAYTLKAEIPNLQGSDDARIKKFNDEMNLLTQEEIAKFKDNAVQVQPMPGVGGSFYDQQYKILSPKGNLLSLKFQIMIYIQGAAHPGTHARTVTYDLEAGKDVKLADLFLQGSDYLEKIANYCVAQLQMRNIGFDPTSSGAQPLPENYGNWNISADGLIITFDEYQVAAYAVGAQEVVVPYAELQSVIDPQGQLEGLLP